MKPTKATEARQAVAPRIDADLMLRLERVTPGYKNADEIHELFRRWERELLILFSI